MARHRLNEGEDTALLPAVAGEGSDAARPRRAWIRRVAVGVAAGALGAVLVLTTGWPLGRSGSVLSWSAPALAPTEATPTAAATATGSPSATATVSPTPTPPPTRTPTPTATQATTPTPTATPKPTPTPTPPVGLVVGQTRSLESVGAPGRYLAGNGSWGELAAVSAGSSSTTKQAATLTVVAGLADTGCYTFRTANGSYLRHRDYQLRVDPFSDTSLFRSDATFCARAGSAAGSVSFESVNYPGYYLHRSGSGLRIDVLVDTGAFRADCSFRVRLPWA